MEESKHKGKPAAAKHPGEKGGGVDKQGAMSGTRVTEYEGETPVKGSPQPVSPIIKRGRVSKAPGLSRKNDPPKKSYERMGLKIGTRVTNKETRQR